MLGLAGLDKPFVAYSLLLEMLNSLLFDKKPGSFFPMLTVFFNSGASHVVQLSEGQSIRQRWAFQAVHTTFVILQIHINGFIFIPAEWRQQIANKIPFYEEAGMCVYILFSCSTNCALSLNLERLLCSTRHSKKIHEYPSRENNVLSCFTDRETFKHVLKYLASLRT